MAEGGDATILPPHAREAVRGLPARDDTPLPRRARSTDPAYGNGAASPPGERVGSGDAPSMVEANA